MRAAVTTMAVPCWSSWKTGISSSFSSVSSISKHSGLLMSSRLMPPNVGAMALQAAMTLAAAYAIADLITDADRSEENIIPGAFDPRVAEAVANAVAKAARETGVARL